MLAPPHLSDLVELASTTAVAAGHLVANARPTQFENKGADLSAAAQIVTDVDRAAEATILDRLRPTMGTTPGGFGLLTEERADDGSRFQHPFFWCIDPLDGTIAFVEGSDGYAVSISLVSRAGVPQLGVVYAPVTNTLYTASRGGGAYKNRRRFVRPAPSSTTLNVYGDRSFNGKEVGRTADTLGLASTTLTIGKGGVLNAIGVLESATGCYFKHPKQARGGGSVWDFAATSCIATELGAVATRFDGQPLDLNPRETSFMNPQGVLFASTKAVAEAVRSTHPAPCLPR